MVEDHVARMFRYSHLPEHLQEVSKPYHDMALNICALLPASAERTLALRKLWEAKNLVVWARVEDIESPN